MTTLEIVLLCLVSLGAALVFGAWARRALAGLGGGARGILTIAGSVDALAAALAAETEARKKHEESVASVPRLLEAHISITASFMEESRKMRECVERFSSLVTNPDQAAEAFHPYSEEEAGKTYRIQRLVASGLSGIDAEAQVRADDESQVLFMPPGEE